MADCRRDEAFLAIGLVFATAGAIGWLAAGERGFSPPELVPRAAAIALLLALPGVIGLVGALGRQPALLVSAGILSIAQSPISFGGATLPFLVPGMFLLRAGFGAGDRPSPRSRVGRGRLAILVALALPVALGAVFTLGVLAPMLLAILAGIAAWRRAPHGRRRVDPRAAAVVVAVVGLVLGAWWSLLATTEEVCWTARETHAGVVYEVQPNGIDAVAVGGDGIVAVGCESGRPTPGGAASASVLAAAALSLAALATGPGPRAR